MSSSFMREFAHLQIPLESIICATNNFANSNFIAKGAYGKVYKGDFSSSEGPTISAVKRWNPLNEEGGPEFGREIMLLSENIHENLITLLGFCDEKKERILVYEYAPNKSLDFHLEDPKLTWVRRLKICLETARGLQ
ncbi:cysteine-rich receptor-like protein kinase 34 [Lactuca sativa]|uniref:cysteine-rich receptor-like protein kinase 34 n=1 Tax=Lactuca sativa TaxID=4236 RepID=UPI000CC9628C|nr:cysteine-rich receptor-like protein kinase 34 [Lactuca sativa]